MKVLNIPVSDVEKSLRLAVYDKKMLWRANLYINENTGRDWNDVHPWVTGNDWNRVHDGKTIFSKLEDLPEVTPALAEFYNQSPVKTRTLVPGGQTVQIADWSPIRGDSITRNTSVSYDYPFAFGSPYLDHKRAMSSPFEFNMDMVNGRETLKKYWTSYRTRNNENSEDLASNGQKYSTLTNWNSTSAPGSKWLNYINNPTGENLEILKSLGITELRLPGLGLYLRNMVIPFLGSYITYSGLPPVISLSSTGRNIGLPESGNAKGLAEKWGASWEHGFAAYYVDSSNNNKPAVRFYGSFSQLPTNSLYWPINEPNYIRPWDAGVRVNGTGTDCIGFVQHAAAYKKEFYAWDNIDLDQAESAEYLDAKLGNRRYPTYNNDGLSYKVANFEDEKKYNLSPLALAVPGDVMYYDRSHIAIVNGNSELDPTKITLQNITLIESTWFFSNVERTSLAEVTNSRTLDSYKYRIGVELLGKKWNIVRLRVK